MMVKNEMKVKYTNLSTKFYTQNTTKNITKTKIPSQDKIITLNKKRLIFESLSGQKNHSCICNYCIKLTNK